ncbi:hypothetical protein [Colwellia piezophila]|uniref:hypothetical protein n=1 Tax=Colwellia piezophila TaxID=211668 RepID=UPI0003787220|nr:hypothetical protein [Colwellia piezophila]
MDDLINNLVKRSCQNQYTNASVLTALLAIVLVIREPDYSLDVIILSCAGVLGIIGFINSLK